MPDPACPPGTALCIAVLGGTGHEGRGLAFRWALAGHRVFIGSRNLDRARASAEEIGRRVAAAHTGAPVRAVEAALNRDAAAAAQVAVLTVPWAAQQPAVEEVRAELAGKILIDVTVPLVPPRVSRVHLPPGGSAVEAVQRLLGEATRVVSAFQHVPAHLLEDPCAEGTCDVLVCGDDPAAREVAVRLANDAGLRGVHAGVLANSAATEALTSVLIAINRHYKIKGGAGLRITGLPG